VIYFSINTNNIVLLNTYFSALAAASYRLASFNSIRLALYIDSLVYSIVIVPPS
jgi:hypothetical protein